jgi:hypothetical protein
MILDEVIERICQALSLRHLDATLSIEHKNGEYVLSIHTKTLRIFRMLQQQSWTITDRVLEIAPISLVKFFKPLAKASSTQMSL